MNNPQRANVGVVALDPLRLAGLQSILESCPGIDSRAVRFEEAIAAEDLAIVLLDSACVGNLPEALMRFRSERQGVRVIVLGDGLGPNQVQAVIAAGAKGYLSGTADEDEIRNAIRVVLEGSVWAEPQVMARLIEAGGVTSPPGEATFANRMTHREREVLRLLMDGQTNRQIADTLGIEPVTVKAHLGRMLRKARVKNRIELTVRAMADAPNSMDPAHNKVGTPFRNNNRTTT
ncbi:MAG TPA: response regulator transcription factor [Acidobacteriaceae bacterium]